MLRLMSGRRKLPSDPETPRVRRDRESGIVLRDDEASSDASQHHTNQHDAGARDRAKPLQKNRPTPVDEWRAEKPTVPPPRQSVTAYRVDLGPRTDELAYRLALGDLLGAKLALEHMIGEGVHVRVRAPGQVVLERSIDEKFFIAAVGTGDPLARVIDQLPLAMERVLSVLCTLVDDEVISLYVPIEGRPEDSRSTLPDSGELDDEL